MEQGVVRFLPKGKSPVSCLSKLRFLHKNFSEGTTKKDINDFEKFKIQIQKIDGSVVKPATNGSSIDVIYPEGNYSLIK